MKITARFVCVFSTVSERCKKPFDEFQTAWNDTSNGCKLICKQQVAEVSVGRILLQSVIYIVTNALRGVHDSAPLV